MIDLIHIGDYKTGTSWWQNQLIPNNPEMLHIDNPVNYPEVVNLMHQLVDSRDLDFDAELVRLKFGSVLDSVDLGEKKIVICREALSGDYPTGDNAKRTAERLHAVFGDTKILIVIREQFSMLSAIYSEYVKIGGTLNFKEFIYDPIVSPGLIEKLKYHKIIDVYTQIFGRENVFIGLFEDFKLDNQLFAKQVLRFINCSIDVPLAEKELIVNPSLKRLGLEIQRLLNHFLRNHQNPRKPLLPIDRVVALFLDDEKKQNLLASTRNRLVYNTSEFEDELVLRYAINFGLTARLSSLCERIQIGPRLTVSDQILENLKGGFIESNKLLSEKYELPVDKFGWVL